ncbi:MAG: sulfite exporter TauE/SafE family protein [Sphingobacteriales bacterium]|nr:sulfite exporter TauE/SafE family protein [Sphingobacteriales bacterium]
MSAEAIIPGFLLGLAGSLHCIGMCGPLSLAIPVGGVDPKNKAFILLSYQAGRISTYGLIGALVGLAGTGILSAGYQQSVSIVAGLVVLIAALGYFAGRSAKPFSFMKGFYQFISSLIFRLLKTARRPGGAFLLGMANGLLPCGMVYIAAIAAISLGNVTDSVSFMLLFGAGTLPAMMFAAYAVRRFGWQGRKWLSRLTPYIIAGMGLLLIIRGLNLGIPYLSPELTQNDIEKISCH